MTEQDAISDLQLALREPLSLQGFTNFTNSILLKYDGYTALANDLSQIAPALGSLVSFAGLAFPVLSFAFGLGEGVSVQIAESTKIIYNAIQSAALYTTEVISNKIDLSVSQSILAEYTVSEFEFSLLFDLSDLKLNLFNKYRLKVIELEKNYLDSVSLSYNEILKPAEISFAQIAESKFAEIKKLTEQAVAEIELNLEYCKKLKELNDEIEFVENYDVVSLAIKIVRNFYGLPS